MVVSTCKLSIRISCINDPFVIPQNDEIIIAEDGKVWSPLTFVI